MNTQSIYKKTFRLTQDGETLQFKGNEALCREDWKSEFDPTETFFDWCKNSYPYTHIIIDKEVLEITPGDWEVSIGGNTGLEHWVFGNDGMTNICQCFGHHTEKMSLFEAKANAALISAAPDLLKSLEQAIECIIEMPTYPKASQLMGLWLKAINKAKSSKL